MTASIGPSDLLVELVNALRAIAAAGPADGVAELFDQARARLTHDGTIEAWTMSAEHVCERGPVIAAAKLLPQIPAEVPAVATALAAMQILDQWHGPLVDDLSGERKSLMAGHAEIAVRFDRNQRFNSDPGRGLLVPRYDPDWRRRPDGMIVAAIEREYAGEVVRGADVGRHLVCTSLIPAELDASHPDAGAGASRRVPVRYVRPPASLATVQRPNVHRLMVAPMLETGADVDVGVTDDGKAYLVRPTDMSSRAARVLECCYAEAATVLLMPEMALTEDALETFRRELSERHAAYVAASGFELPPLCWVVVGVVEDRGERTRNHVVVLTADGQSIADQDKITRWNMNLDEQLQYALDPPAGLARPDLLEEPIEPASVVWLIDLPALGRLAILICADMDVPEPGDWLYANSGLDWIYAPIMDRTRVPVREKGRIGPWIVKRAHRAACAAKARAVVTNSMALTTVVNGTNAARGLDAMYPAATDCHISLMVDATGDHALSESIVVELTRGDVVEVREWNDAWTPFLED